MAITFTTTGPFDPTSIRGPNAQTSYATYSFSSGIITATANYADNVLDFGSGLSEIWIVAVGGAVCFQFPELYGTNKDSGIVLADDKISFRRLNKRGVKIRRADAAAAATCYLFGI